jgi:mono/diheme cytochrome c family protein
MMKSILTVALMLVVSVGLFAQAGGNAEGKKLKNPAAASPQSIQAGQASFQKACAVCHGPMGKGDGAIVAALKPEATKPSNLVDDKWTHGSTDGEIFVVIRDGIGPKFEMKGQKGKLTDAEMWNLVNYVRSLGPKTK